MGHPVPRVRLLSREAVSRGLEGERGGPDEVGERVLGSGAAGVRGRGAGERAGAFRTANGGRPA